MVRGGRGGVWFGDPGEHDLRGHSGRTGGLGHGAAGRESNFLEPLLVAFTPVKLPIDFFSEKPTD